MTTIIAVEGIDGAGKTFFTAALEGYLTGKNYSVLTTSFPGYTDNRFGQQIGKYLSGAVPMPDKFAFASMFALDRRSWFMQNSLFDMDYLICNRYTLSNIVYQGFKFEWMDYFEHVLLKIPRPDIYIILDCDPNVATVNNTKKGKREYLNKEQQIDLFEQDLERQTLARQMYLQYADDINAYSFIKTRAIVVPVSEKMSMRPIAKILEDVVGEI